MELIFGVWDAKQTGFRSVCGSKILLEFSAILGIGMALLGVFSWKIGRENGFLRSVESQKWHFWGAKVVQKGGKCRTLGAQKCHFWGAKVPQL